MGQLGDTFRERRASLGISLDTAESETRIRKRLLEALEAGDYDKLPNPGYVRGYVSSYARYLELDPIPMLAMYRAETGAGRYHDINIADEPLVRRHEQHAVPWRVGVIAFAIIAVLALLGWATYRAMRPTTTPPIPATTGSATSKGSTTTQNTVPPFTLKVTASNNASTVKVIVNGAIAFDGTLTSGESQTFQVSDTAVVSVGKPSAVTVTRDGKTLQLPNKTPAVLNLKASQP